MVVTNSNIAVSVLIALFALAAAGRFAGPPVLWGTSGVCAMQKDGVSVSVEFPVKYPINVEYGDVMIARSRKFSIRFDPYGSLESYLSDFIYSPEPYRYPYRRMVFSGHDAATATDDGLVTGGEPRTDIEIPVAPVTVNVGYFHDAMPSAELQAVLDSITITNTTDLKEKAECFLPLIPFDII